MSIDWPENLVQEVAERRVVFFIGAGFSKSAQPDLPGWDKLILDLGGKLRIQARFLELKKLVKQGQLLDAAELVVSELGRADCYEKLKDTFRIRPTPSAPTYQDLLNLDPKVIVTTNYDEFLERNFDVLSGENENSHFVRKQDHIDLIADLRSPERLILKPHGCITDMSSIVLDRSSYFSLRRKFPGYFKSLSALLTTNTIVFLGYGVGDPDIQLILEESHSFTESAKPHYAVVPKLPHPSLKKSLRSGFNLEALEYPAGKHADMAAALSRLWKDVESFRASRGMS
ncbi:SIR2 family protein [Jannaschia formosa]|uniref:SIR2 family protein n=1 Tax=Jannaschia formosa TaxID=2259592 RepID=UPI000E1B6B37|nr:SIR2 family protein [Jannaschia formosa]TFL18835.1 hypothetical protein DR046_07895 [Jannaschia formosa]